MSKNIFFFILAFISSPLFLNSQNIAGDDIVCLNECQTYTIDNASGGLFVWNVDGGKLDVNTGTSVRICWNEEGEHTIKVLDLSNGSSNPVLTFDVKVVGRSYPEVYFPEVPSCIGPDSLSVDPNQEFPPLECHSACENSMATYTAIGLENSTFEWTISGANSSNAQGESVNISWGDAGYGYFIVESTNEAGCVEVSEYCIQILEEPSATIVNNTNATNPCVGQTVYLEADSPEAVSFTWEVNNEILSDEQILEYEIASSDIQNIVLITTSECLCQDTTYYTITPIADPGPQINCVGTTCLGEEQTYYAEDICGTYNWVVSAEGSIIDGGNSNDNFITVIWNSGPVGEISLSAQDCQSVVCGNTTTLQVPIVEPTLVIEGPDVTCKKGQSIFTVQKLAGTNYNWSISGNGFIIDGLNTNQITVQWEEANWADDQSTITLNYDNCLLECGGSASKNVSLLPEFVVSSFDPNVCVGEEVTVEGISGYSSVDGDWEVFDKSGALIATEINEDHITFTMPNDPGLIEVKLTNTSGAYCNETSSGFVTAVALPEPPLSFDGPTSICKNEILTYEASIELPENLELIWSFNDGGAITSLQGNKVTYEWTSNGPFSIEVVSKDVFTNCESQPLVVQIQAAENTFVEGNLEVCLKQLYSYTLNGVDSDDIEWNITPASAGNFHTSLGKDTEVTFYEAGRHQLTANYCGTSLTIEVAVMDDPTFTYNAPTALCEGETGPVAISTDIGNTIEVTDEQFNVVASTTNFDAGPGIYTVKVTSPLGCETIEVVQINTYILPSIRISSPDEKGKCTFPFDVNLYGINTLDGYTYQWYKDDVAMGLTDVNITVNDFGIYHLEVSNINGCVKESNKIKVYEECRFSDGYCDGRCENLVICESMDSINFEVTSLGFCNTYSFKNTSTANVDPSTLFYDFDNEESGTFNRLYAEDGEHTFTHAGYYVVMLTGKVPYLSNPSDLCDDFETKVIEVPVAARFESQEGCSNTEYQFLDKSTFVGSNTIVAWEWDFGDPSSGSDNFSTDTNPTHTYSQGGTYLITLTITAGTGCKSRIIQEIRVLQSPVFELNLPFEQCISEAIKFEAVDTGNLIKYKWEFDDPTGGNSNLVEAPSTLHKFETPGVYSISLTCYNNLGCESTVVKNFEVGTNSLTGDITLDKTLPICEGDSITLSAPNGGVGYIWSNGDVGQEIKVADADIYTVTVINSAACDYVPDPVEITVKPRPNIEIFSVSYESNSFEETYTYDKVEICEGEQANLRTQYIFNASYLWSTGGTQWYNSQAMINTLAPGEYLITVDVTTDVGCTFTSDPFTVVIHPKPNTFTITSDQSDMCEGKIFNFTIDNPDPDLTYYWNTGQSGTSIATQIPGSYWAIAINEFGCERISNVLTIYEKPNMTYFQTGCYETCFPDEICFPQSSNLSLISWLKDGQLIPSANGNVLTVTEAGKYQVIVETLQGCSEISDILTLEAMPSDQSVRGIVYVDDNKNGLHDSGEELLENININLMMGSTILETVVTNNLGEYVIDPVTSNNTYVEIDTTGTGLLLDDSNIRYDLVFDFCVEDKEQDFPVNKDCPGISKNVNLVVCQGETINYNGQIYGAGDTDNLIFTSVSGCDTTVMLTVTEASVPLINSTTQPSCENEANGQLSIQTTEVGLMYSIDGTNFSSNTDFGNLGGGNYDLDVLDANGCTFSFPFIVQEILEPAVSFNTTPSCEGESSGSIEAVTTDPDLMYSIDGINFSSQILIDNLIAGSYSIFVMNASGCTYNYLVDVTEAADPVVSFNISPSCSNSDNGSLEITFADPGTTFSFNGVDFASDLVYNNLGAGSLDLYVSNSNQCISAYAITIPVSQAPVVTALTTNTCQGENNGVIELQSTDAGVLFSLDGINYNTQNSYSGLGEGLLSYFIQDANGCEYEEQIMIEAFEQPNLNLNTSLSCNDDGLLEVINNDGNVYEYSLTNSNFSSDNEFPNLPPGDYTLFVLNNNNCIHEENFEIQAAVEPLLQFDITPSCISSSSGMITAISNNPQVQFALDGGLFSSANIFENLDPATYNLSVQDEHGCIFNHQVNVEEIAALDIAFDDPVIDCSMLSVNLAPQIVEGSNLAYTWSNGSTESTISVSQSGTYNVEIDNGCETVAYEWNLEFDNINEQSIFVPNVFSPNNDGTDDGFKAFKSPDLDIMEYELMVFDKWGNKVFEDSDFDGEWDGRNNLKDVQSGVYVWMYKMKANYCNQEVSLSDQGSVTLLR